MASEKILLNGSHPPRHKMQLSNVGIQMVPEDPIKVAIIGSGSFGLALAKEFARAGIPVCIGSRTPAVCNVGIPKTKKNFG